MANQTDNTIIQLFLPILNNALTADGFINVSVKQSNQPTMQGANTNPTLYFYKLNNKRYGFLGRTDKYSNVSTSIVHTESQYYESTWSMMALVLQNPATPTYTASDLVNEAADIMQSDSTRAILNQSGVGILRITDVTNPYFTDDRDNFEASPSFSFTFIYQNFRTSTTPNISEFNQIIYGV